MNNNATIRLINAVKSNNIEEIENLCLLDNKLDFINEVYY